MSKQPSSSQPVFHLEDREAPTQRIDAPSEVRDAPVSVTTTKLPKADLEALLIKESRERSGTRRAVSDDDLERFERRQADTLPAPPNEECEAVPPPLALDLSTVPPPDDAPKK